MRVAYVGNFGPSHSTENHVAGSLRLLGHEVVEFQEDEQNGHESTLSARVLAAGCELLLYTKTWGLDPAPTMQAWADLEAAGVPTVSYHLDLYAGLDREEQLDREPFWQTRFVFSADGGSDDVFAAHGIDHEWLRAGVFGPECVPGRRDSRWRRVDVGFVGSHQAYHVEWPYRLELVRWLKRTYRSSFGVWPQGGRAIRGQALNDLYASVPVFVGDSLCPGFDHWNYWSDRVYETLGRGGFLIHPFIKGMDDEFVDGEHLRFYDYGDFDGLRSLIDHYVAHPSEARAIADRGQAFVAAHCTYERRVETMLDKLITKGALGDVHLDAARPVARRMRSRLGRWTAEFDPRAELGHVGGDEGVIVEVWDHNDYRIDPARALHGTVIDVGANIGAFSVLAAKAGAERVIAVEPEPANRERLAHHLQLNGVAGSVNVLGSIVTGDAITPLAMSGTGGGAHTTYAHSANDELPTVTLNDLIATYAPVALLKVDIEGGEFDAFDDLPVERLRDVERIVMEWHGPAMPHLAHLVDRVPGDVRYFASAACDTPTERTVGYTPESDALAAAWWNFGRLVAKLADAGRVETFGHPSRGGLIYWTRY